jgi:hypothetical protein
MKVLLDVCTPVQVRLALADHEVHTAVRMGWGELENGELLRVAESAGFELFIICDKNLRQQRTLRAGGWRSSNSGQIIARRWSSIFRSFGRTPGQCNRANIVRSRRRKEVRPCGYISHFLTTRPVQFRAATST